MPPWTEPARVGGGVPSTTQGGERNRQAWGARRIAGALEDGGPGLTAGRRRSQRKLHSLTAEMPQNAGMRRIAEAVPIAGRSHGRTRLADRCGAQKGERSL